MLLMITVLRQRLRRSVKTVKYTTSATSLLGRRARNAILVAGLLPAAAFAQTALTWQQIKDKFAAANPTLKAAALNIDESRAAEITAYLRPNPSFALSTDGTQLSRFDGHWLRRSSALSLDPALVTRTNASKSGSCGGTRPRNPPPSRNRVIWTRNAIWCLRCEAHLFKCCRRKPCCRTHRRT